MSQVQCACSSLAEFPVADGHIVTMQCDNGGNVQTRDERQCGCCVNREMSVKNLGIERGYSTMKVWCHTKDLIGQLIVPSGKKGPACPEYSLLLDGQAVFSGNQGNINGLRSSQCVDLRRDKRLAGPKQLFPENDCRLNNSPLSDGIVTTLAGVDEFNSGFAYIYR